MANSRTWQTSFQRVNSAMSRPATTEGVCRTCLGHFSWKLVIGACMLVSLFLIQPWECTNCWSAWKTPLSISKLCGKACRIIRRKNLVCSNSRLRLWSSSSTKSTAATLSTSSWSRIPPPHSKKPRTPPSGTWKGCRALCLQLMQVHQSYCRESENWRTNFCR